MLILDWSGMDYAPYAINKESIGNVGLDEDAIIEYLLEKARNFGYSGYQKDSNPIRDALEDFVGDDWSAKSSEYKNAEDLKKAFEQDMTCRMEAVAQEDRRQNGLPRRLNRGLRKISDMQNDFVRDDGAFPKLFGSFEDGKALIPRIKRVLKASASSASCSISLSVSLRLGISSCSFLTLSFMLDCVSVYLFY